MVSSFPTSPKELTVEWLDSALRKNGILTDATVTSLVMEAPDRAGGMGTVVRCRLTFDSIATAAPRSLIAKFAMPDPEFRIQFNAFRGANAEVFFYEQIAKSVDIRTPHCYFSAADRKTGEFLFLLEDVDYAVVGNWSAGTTVERTRQVVCEIAKLHAAWWDHPELANLESLTLWTPETLQDSIDSATWESYMSKIGENVPNSVAEIGAKLGYQLADIERQLMSPPRTLIHFDLHLDNLFFSDLGSAAEVIIIDWQFLTIDNGMKDIAFFLGGNLDSGEHRIHAMEILHAYHATLQNAGVEGYSFEQCFYEYRLALLDSWARFIMTIGRGYDGRERVQFLNESILPRFYSALIDTRAGELLK